MRKIFVYTVVFLMLMVGPGMSQALDQAVLKWDNPSQRQDGTVFTPSNDQRGVDVYYGTTTPPTTIIHVLFTTPTTPGGNTYPALATGQTYTVTGLQYATKYYFAVRAVDYFGQAGTMSNIVSKTTITPTVPAGCTNITVQ